VSKLVAGTHVPYKAIGYSYSGGRRLLPASTASTDPSLFVHMGAPIDSPANKALLSTDEEFDGCRRTHVSYDDA